MYWGYSVLFSLRLKVSSFSESRFPKTPGKVLFCNNMVFMVPFYKSNSVITMEAEKITPLGPDGTEHHKMTGSILRNQFRFLSWKSMMPSTTACLCSSLNSGYMGREAPALLLKTPWKYPGALSRRFGQENLIQKLPMVGARIIVLQRTFAGSFTPNDGRENDDKRPQTISHLEANSTQP